MAFSELPQTLQLIQLYNFDIFLRLVWIMIIISVSAIYWFYFKNIQKETPFISIAIMRGLMSKISAISLIISPFFFFFLSPESPSFSFIEIYFTFYIIFLTIFLLTIVVDLWRFSIPVLIKMGGMKVDDPKAVRIYNKYFKKNGRH